MIFTVPCTDFTAPEQPSRPVRITIEGGCLSVAAVAGPPQHDTGWLLLPGLSDAHVHVAALEFNCGRDFLSCGVTHVRDVGGPLSNTLYWSQKNDFPHVTHYGWAIDADPPQPHASLLGTVAARSPEAVVRHVHRLARHGASGLKLYYGFPPPLVELAVQTAHDYGLNVAYHIGSGSHPRFRMISAHDAIVAGVDSIEHIHSLTGDVLPSAVIDELASDNLEVPGAVFFRIFCAWARVNFDQIEPRRIIDRFVEHGTVFVPTLSPFAAMLDEVPAIDVGVVSLFRRTADANDLAIAKCGFERMLEFVRLYCECGGRLAVGTDTTSSTGVTPRQGFRSELNLLLRAGLTPTQILRAASVASQAQMGLAPRAIVPTRLLVQSVDLGAALADIAPRYVFAADRVIYAAESIS